MESNPQEWCRVVTDYRSAYPDPIVLGAGDEITVEDRESEWSGWLWCTARDGNSGWVPADYVRRSGRNGTALRDYDATELSVTEGEQLMIIEEVNSWYWCRAEDGRLGWVPMQNVVPVRVAMQNHGELPMIAAEKRFESAERGKKELEQCFQEIRGYFSPKIIGEVNDVYVKVTKVKGDDVPWHTHDHEDELFYIFKGSLVMEIANEESFTLHVGELFIVKKGVRHRVYSTDECWVLLVENKATKHTGNVASGITKTIEDQL